MSTLIQPRDLIKPKINSAVDYGFTTCHIIQSKYAGIQRPAKQEPWEAERLLVASRYKRESHGLGFTEDTWAWKPDHEPGQYKYYIFLLPFRAELRASGYNGISAHYLEEAQSFENYQEALEAFEAYP